MSESTKIISTYGLGSVTRRFVTSLASFALDAVQVQAGNHWRVKNANFQVGIENSAPGTFTPSSGDHMGIYICPPSTPGAESGNAVGIADVATIIGARPIVIVDFPLGLAYGTYGSDYFNAAIDGGINGATYFSLRAPKDFIVPATWNLRAIINLSGSSGGFSANSFGQLNFLYAEESNCQ